MGKAKKAPFAIFVDKQRGLNPEWRSKSNQEVFDLAGPLWKQLNDNERSVYVKEAKRLKEGAIYKELNNNYSDKKVHGYDAIGRSLADIEERDKYLIENANYKTETVKKMIEDAELAGTVEYQEFSVIHANIFVKTDETNIIVPAEIAVTKFSIEKGILENYQTFIEPGPVPTGYKYKCFEMSETKHKIPLYPELITDPNSTMRPQCTPYPADAEIIQNIKKVLGSSKILFTMPECEDICSGVLKTVANRAKVAEIDVTILPLPELLYRLANKMDPNTKQMYVPTATMALSQFEKERFLYSLGLSCAWHESETDTSNCSQGFVMRWIYTILGFTNDLYDVQINIEDGKHVPKGLLQDANNDDAKWDTKEKPKYHGDDGFGSTDIRYRDSESVADTISEFMNKTSISEFDSEYEVNEATSSSVSVRSNQPSSARSSMTSVSATGSSKAAGIRGTLLHSLRSSRLAANLD